MSVFRLDAHVCATVLPFSNPVSDLVRVRHAIPVEILQLNDDEAPHAGVVDVRPGDGPATVPMRLRRRVDGFYVEVLGPRMESLTEDRFASLVARAGTAGPQGPYTWGLNPFGSPPPDGAGSPSVPDGRLIAMREAARIAVTLISVQGQPYVRRPAPGWRVEDRGGTTHVRPYAPSGRPDPAPAVVGRGLSGYWVDVPGDRPDVLDEMLVGGRLIVDGAMVPRVGTPGKPPNHRTHGIERLSLGPAYEVTEAITRLVRASPGLEPSSSKAAKAWVALRDQAKGVPDVAACMDLLGQLAERERVTLSPTLGTAAWMEVTRLRAIDARAPMMAAAIPMLEPT